MKSRKTSVAIMAVMAFSFLSCEDMEVAGYSLFQSHEYYEKDEVMNRICTDLTTHINFKEVQLYGVDAGLGNILQQIEPSVTEHHHVVAKNTISGDLWVAPCRNGQNLYRCDGSGNILNTYDLSGDFPSTFQILALAHDHVDNSILMLGINAPVDFTDPQIRVYSYKKGAVTLKFSYSEEDLSWVPSDLTVDANRYVWIAEKYEKKIKKFTIDGTLADTIDLSSDTDLICITGIAYNRISQTLWIAKSYFDDTKDTLAAMTYYTDPGIPPVEQGNIRTFNIDDGVVEIRQNIKDIYGVDSSREMAQDVDPFDNTMFVLKAQNELPPLNIYHYLHGKEGNFREFGWQGISELNPSWGTGDDYLRSLSFDPKTGDLWGAATIHSVRNTKHWLVKYNRQTGAIMEIRPNDSGGDKYSSGFGTWENLMYYGLCPYRDGSDNLKFYSYYHGFDPDIGRFGTKRIGDDGYVEASGLSACWYDGAEWRPAMGMRYDVKNRRLISTHANGNLGSRWRWITFISRDISFGDSNVLLSHNQMDPDVDYLGSIHDLGLFRNHKTTFAEYYLTGVATGNSAEFDEVDNTYGNNWKANGFEFLYGLEGVVLGGKIIKVKIKFWERFGVRR